MQVFIPYSSYSASLKVLDSKRLQKQGIEASQILDTIYDLPTKTGKPRTGWLNHPAVIMWEDNTGALVEYLEFNIAECIHRGIKTDYVEERLPIYQELTSSDSRSLPLWWGDERVHSSHRVRLLQKGWEEKLKYGDKANKTIEWYNQWQWNEMNARDFFRREYKWATNITATSYQLEERVSKAAMKVKDQLIAIYGINPYGTN